jgi:hypothetical protein
MSQFLPLLLVYALVLFLLLFTSCATKSYYRTPSKRPAYFVNPRRAATLDCLQFTPQLAQRTCRFSNTAQPDLSRKMLPRSRWPR